MISEYALLKLQSINGEEMFIHSVPALLCSKRAREPLAVAGSSCHLEILPITNIIDTSPYHALIRYTDGAYHITAITPLLLNSQTLTPSPLLAKALASEKLQAESIQEYVKGAEGEG